MISASEDFILHYTNALIDNSSTMIVKYC